MPQENVNPGHRREALRCEGFGWRSARASAFLLIVAMFPPGSAAQTASSTVALAAQSSVVGAGSQGLLRFAEEPESANELSVTMGVSTFYDDNVLETNQARVSDEALALTSHVTGDRQTDHLIINFDYLPFFDLYRKFYRYDRLNQNATLGLTYVLSPRIRVGVHDIFGYENGVYPALSGDQPLSGLPALTGLNSTIYSPTIRTLSNVTGLEVLFLKSRRTSLRFFGGYVERTFASQTVEGQPLYNSTGVNGGAQFEYMVTEHTTLGVLLLHQDMTYRGGEVFGNQQRSQIESLVFSAGLRLSPTVTVNAYGGPQYFHTLDQSVLGSRVPGSFEPAGGGSVTKQVRTTALNLAVQRSVSDGGGLYTSVINTSASLGVRHRLLGRWEANWQASAGESDTSLLLVTDKTKAVFGTITFSRPVGGTTLRVSYSTAHQLVRGLSPFQPNIDRNLVTIGFDFRLKTIPLGK